MGYTVTPPGRTPRARGRSFMPGGRIGRGRLGVGGLVVLLLVPAMVRAQAMRWPEAVAALAAERTRAETCVRLLKRHAGEAVRSRGKPAYAEAKAAVLSQGELVYVEAKAAVDAVIAGLIVVLAERGTPPDLADLEMRLTRGVQRREDFCKWVITYVVPPDPGTRNFLVPLVGTVLPPLLEAARTLYTGRTEQDRLVRQTIQTQLEATK
jgi:hypothetical protein